MSLSRDRITGVTNPEVDEQVEATRALTSTAPSSRILQRNARMVRVDEGAAIRTRACLFGFWKPTWEMGERLVFAAKRPYVGEDAVA